VPDDYRDIVLKKLNSGLNNGQGRKKTFLVIRIKIFSLRIRVISLNAKNYDILPYLD
jgi:hypothetical protein